MKLPKTKPIFDCPKCSQEASGKIIFSSHKDIAYIKCDKCGYITQLDINVGWELKI